MLKQDVLNQAAVGEGCLGHAREDEPIFVLRGRDVLAPATIRRWADLAEAASHPDSPTRAKAIKARADAKEFENWQQTHGAKIPD